VTQSTRRPGQAGSHACRRRAAGGRRRAVLVPAPAHAGGRAPLHRARAAPMDRRRHVRPMAVV